MTSMYPDLNGPGASDSFNYQPQRPPPPQSSQYVPGMNLLILN
jgi:hypothetical protein